MGQNIRFLFSDEWTLESKWGNKYTQYIIAFEWIVFFVKKKKKQVLAKTVISFKMKVTEWPEKHLRHLPHCTGNDDGF